MPEIDVKAEVAGRVCELPLSVGAAVEAGTELLFVEAMKMEIPVLATASGTLSALHVGLDDMVQEGQRVATIST